MHADTTQHQFKEAGTFVLSCMEDAEIAMTITVIKEEKEEKSEKAILYIHVALMLTAFGIVFPIAAFLNHHRVNLAYKILHPFGLIPAVCGLVAIVVYVQLADRKEHFDFLIHSVVGLALLVLVLLIMPVLILFQKTRAYYFSAGHIVAFFGMGNVLLVSWKWGGKGGRGGRRGRGGEEGERG